MKKKVSATLIPLARIEGAILDIRGERVMLARDLARIYGVTTKALNQAVKRNAGRFPEDFMFQLTREEAWALRSQSVTSNGRPGRGGMRYLPYAFTEHGAVMLASVLRSKRAVEVSVFVVKAFVRMRRMLADQRQLALKLAELESKLGVHDRNFQQVFATLRQLMQQPQKKPGQIGFQSGRKS